MVLTATGMMVEPLQYRCYLHPKYKDSKIFENHLNPVMLVSIGKLLLSALEYPYSMVSVTSQFFLHHFVLAKLATSSIIIIIRVIKAHEAGPSLTLPPLQ